MRDVEAVPAEPARRSGRSPVRRVLSGSPEQRRLLALQRTVGNAVVARAAEEGVELSELGGPAPVAQAGPSVPQHSLEIGFPQPPEQQSPWFQLFCCGTGRKSSGPETADAWRAVLAAARQDNQRFDEDSQLRFHHDTRTVLVRYHARELRLTYPKLAGELVKRATDLVRGGLDDARNLTKYGEAYPPTAGYWNREDEDRVALGRNAAHAAESAALRPEPADPVPANSRAVPAEVFRQVIADGSDGLVIGENHAETHAYYFLADNMAELKSKGLRTIYLELLRVGPIQQWVDDYLAGGAEMPPQLDNALREGARHDGPRRVIEAAKQHGVRVRAADGFSAQRRYLWGQDGEAWGKHERAGLMNSFTTSVIDEDSEGRGRYVAVVGEAHARDHRFSGRRDDLGGVDSPQVPVPELPELVPGLTRYLGVPAIRLTSPDQAVSIDPARRPS
ncbi:hypothetical protein ABZ805_10760 [Saccharopolyspora sp. NPDC047091]|uniref:hypothetical protein n=1 Tax=Saccharopolyspora sp. NPDC047091 TaxID=3155924 RepID=UPI0033E20696